MEYHLAIETSNAPTSIALLKDGDLIGEKTIVEQKQTAALLAGCIPELLSHAGIKKSNLSWISVSMGPGSYTGLRVGLSLAKGLAYALGIPIVPVSSLEAYAYGFTLENPVKEKDQLIPLFNARKGNVYAAIYSGTLDNLKNPNRYSLSELLKELDTHKKIFLFSAEPKIFDNLIGEKHSIKKLELKAEFVGKLGFIHRNFKLFNDIAYLNPTYIINKYV